MTEDQFRRWVRRPRAPAELFCQLWILRLRLLRFRAALALSRLIAALSGH